MDNKPDNKTGTEGIVSKKFARLIGGAGTGKTTELLQIMKSIIGPLGGDPAAIGFGSFTTAAREEMVNRAAAAFDCHPSMLSRHGWFRTVHSTCYKMLDIKPEQLLSGDDKSVKWIAEQLRVTVQRKMVDDSGYASYVGDEEAAAALTLWDISRNRVVPVNEVHRERSNAGLDVPSIAAVKHFVKRYEEAKRLHDKHDFVDIVGRYGGIRFEIDGPEHVEPEGDLPHGVKAWILDEYQDSSKLVDTVCRRLVSGPEVQWAYTAADPFQCQPAGTPVLTTRGYQPIELLDPESDWIIAFNRKESQFYGTGKKIKFQRAWRDVDSGDLIEVSFSDGTKSLCTPNHKWVVRTVKQTAYATYIMRKGTRWRIGTVQVFGNGSSQSVEKNGDFRVKMRMNQEDADSVWLLKVFATDREARMYEQIASFKYGVPQTTFRPPCGSKNNLDADFINTVFDALGDLTENGLRCLRDHDLEVLFPFCTKACRSKNGSKATRFIQAANLLPGIHIVPKMLPGMNERRSRWSGGTVKRTLSGQCEWVTVESIRRLPAGETVRVYSLNVENHHTYVTTNGIVTGNSIFGFGGADYNNFMAWAVDKERTMPQSWRCPRPIMDLGERCLKRMRQGYFDRQIAPASHDGCVIREPSIERALHGIDPSRTTLILARCNYSLAKYAAILEQRKIPHARINQDDDTIALTAFNALWKLQHGKGISGDAWKAAISLTPQKGAGDEVYLVRGQKAQWKDGRRDSVEFVHPDDLLSAGCTPEFVARIKEGRWAGLLNGATKWFAAAVKYGPEQATKPNVRLSTIHGAKGMEAQDVVLATETAARVEAERDADPRIHDEECRIEYVAVTRAKERLIVCEADEPYSMRLPL